MSEKMYALLLRLFPASFQKTYREEALQLIRDRSRDERGVLSRVRLWFDLLSDLVISVPRSFQTAPVAIVRRSYGGAPSFLLLEDEVPSFGSLLYGAVGSLSAYSVVLILLSHGGSAFPIRVSDIGQSPNNSGAMGDPISAADSSMNTSAIEKLGPGNAFSHPSFQTHPGSTFASTMLPMRSGEPSALLPVVNNDGRPLAFDVVSIHVDKSGLGLRNARNGPTLDGYQLRGGPLLTVIQTAYLPTAGSFTFRPNQISGLPPWAFNQILYNIDAKVSEADLASWKNSALQPAMLHAMLQTMLADRFQLAVHRENKIVPIYELTLGKKHPRLKPYDGETLAEIQKEHPGAHPLAGGPIVAVGPNPGQQWFFGVTVSELGTLLSNLAGRPVLDRTGLKGRYNVSYQLELRPPPQTDGTPAPMPPDFFSSQISTIVQDQLGLKLKATTGPVESLVIDHVEQPSEN